MRASDVISDEDGVHLFNVNQVAYLVEGCTNKVEQRTTKRRIAEALSSIQVTQRACQRTGNGESLYRQTDN